MDLILRVFTTVGQEMTKDEAIAKLKEEIANDPNKEQKAAGSLGGAVNGGTLIRIGDKYKRVK